jgi:hypothetical protein
MRSVHAFNGERPGNIMYTSTKHHLQPEVGKVTLKSNGNKALSDESLKKSNGDEALNDHPL